MATNGLKMTLELYMKRNEIKRSVQRILIKAKIKKNLYLFYHENFFFSFSIDNNLRSVDILKMI
jgi:predicted 2-oxoglutarate/Fe(II)-dependent dioxygenase YbiX